MNTNRTVQVGTWDSAAAAPPKRVASGGSRYWPPAVRGLIGTLVIHLVLVPSVLIETRVASQPVKFTRQGTPGPQISSDSEDLVLIELPQSSESGADFTDIDDRSGRMRPTATITAVIRTDVPHVHIPDDSANEIASSHLTSDSQAQSTREHLIGIYSGQIRARIERIWRRPRSPVYEANEAGTPPKNPEEFFHCQVRIIQDSAGWVQETQLLSCNGSIAWQESLVRAINQASPLPAPPNPKVFARAVTLNFAGFAFGRGMESDDYEVQISPTVEAVSQIR